MVKDDDGCPDEKPQEIKQTLILRGVNFKTASAECWKNHIMFSNRSSVWKHIPM